MAVNGPPCEQEVWRWVDGYEGLYMVSQFGRVMSVPKHNVRGRVLAVKKSTGGYLQVCLSKDNKKKYVAVHRIVASAFIANPQNKPQVNHKDGCRTNNHASNLEWVTASENNTHSYRVLNRSRERNYFPARARRRFSDEQVRAIRSDPRGATAIARDYGVSKTAIMQILKGKTYREVK